MGSTGPQKLVTVVRSGLAGEVQYVRNRCGLSLEVVCNQLGWQQSKLSRMERGHQAISAADLASLLVIYKVIGHERRRLLHLVERQDEPGRWIVESSGAPAPLARLEAEAISLVVAQLVLIPGLVQTAEYAHEVMRAADVPPDLADARVKARLERQLVLARAKPPKLDIILDEIALRRVIGSDAVMARQLRALLKAADRPNVRLWVVPFGVGGRVGFESSFYIINFPQDESVVQLASKRSDVYLEDQEEIDLFREHAAKLGKAALDPAKSVALVASIARGYEQK
jgi:transcriptional regulator with XRE-family HTH domain